MLAQRWQWAWVCLSICLPSATDRSWCVSARSWAVAASLSAPSALKPTHRGHAQIQAKSPLRWDSTCRPIHAALCPPCPLKVGFGQVPQPSKQSNKSAKPRRAKAAAILAKPNCRYPLDSRNNWPGSRPASVDIPHLWVRLCCHHGSRQFANLS